MSLASQEPRTPEGEWVPNPRRGARTALVAGASIVAVVAALLVIGVVPRLERDRRLDAQTRAADAPPVVTVAVPTSGDSSSALSLPGTLYGLHEAALHARVSGYVTRIEADIGSHVAEGATLAVLDMPEVEQELQQARATLEQLQASGELARATRDRWQKMIDQSAATRQEFEEKQASFNVSRASVRAAEANVERLTALRRFGRIVAPFSGVITARSVDVGALVSPGSTTASRPLFQLAQVDRIRVVTYVPQSAAASVRVDQEADVAVAELGASHFKGRVMRTARALDPATRTLLTEIEVANRDGRLLPGMFAQVSLSLQRGASAHTIRVPANTLIIRADGPQVAVVSGGVVKLSRVTLGRDFGSEVELLGGIAATDSVVVNPSDDVRTGARVRVAKP